MNDTNKSREMRLRCNISTYINIFTLIPNSMRKRAFHLTKAPSEDAGSRRALRASLALPHPPQSPPIGRPVLRVCTGDEIRKSVGVRRCTHGERTHYIYTDSGCLSFLEILKIFDDNYPAWTYSVVTGGAVVIEWGVELWEERWHAILASRVKVPLGTTNQNNILIRSHFCVFMCNFQAVEIKKPNNCRRQLGMAY